jgi:VIT1/CCC1 family predicted Fe2+/Mn2+ transporter
MDYGAMMVSDNPAGHDVFFYHDDDDNNNKNNRNHGPHDVPPYTDTTDEVLLPHLGKNRQYWRDMILGVNDGLISTFLLVVGVSGGHHVLFPGDDEFDDTTVDNMDTTPILLTALAGALAGMVSMAAGEYVATKAQNEVLGGELALEERHIAQHPALEVAELTQLLPLIGLGNVSGVSSPPLGSYTDNGIDNDDDDESSSVDRLQQDLKHFYAAHPHALWKLTKVLEFGILDEEVRSPVWAALTSGCLFGLGALPSIAPYLWCDTPAQGLGGATLLTALALLVVGGVKTWATRTSWIGIALENLLIAGSGGLVAYAVGAFFDWLLVSSSPA